MNKQILKYTGGKWRIAEWVIKHFPPHKVYVEACFGSGAIFFTKQPSADKLISEKKVIPINGTMNPVWVEWLQGFPMGWTELDA